MLYSESHNTPLHFLSMTLSNLLTHSQHLENTQTMPTFFIGHGSPMNAVEDNQFTNAWKEQTKDIPKANAILCVSAHWLTDGTFVQTTKHPETIYDFYGFPDALYTLKYPAPGSPEYANVTQKEISSRKIVQDHAQGFDHWTWVILKHMFPDASIPVFQMSIDYYEKPEVHYQLGKELAGLREKGVLIIGSGNIVHNLRTIHFDTNASTFPWAKNFDEKVAECIKKDDHEQLLAYEKLGEDARLSVPTPDHYYPLLYILGTKKPQEQIRFFAEGMTNGSIGMRSLRIG